MLEGKKALIIGGTGGTGLEIAKLLLKENCSVYITGRHFPEIFTTEKWQDFKNKIHFFHTDFSSHNFSFTEEFNAFIRDTNIFCYCFGPFLQKPIHLTTENEWRYLSFYNTTFPGILLSKLLPFMIDTSFGRIIFFGGTRTESVKAYKTNAPYAACKTALSVLVKSTAAHYSQHNITCNGILPGFTDNPPQNTKVTAREFLASQALYLLKSSELSGVLLNADRGWSPLS